MCSFSFSSALARAAVLGTLALLAAHGASAQQPPASISRIPYYGVEHRVFAFGVSTNGSVVVGAMGNSTGPTWPFRLKDGVLQAGGPSYWSGHKGTAEAVSGNGHVVVGSLSGSFEPGITSKGYLYDTQRDSLVVFDVPGCNTAVRHVSRDGSIALGLQWFGGTDPAQCPYQAFMWRNGQINYLPIPMEEVAGLNGLSGDGRTVILSARTPGTTTGHAWLWTAEGGVEVLPEPAGAYSCNPASISQDGRTVGLLCHLTTGPGTFDTKGYLWTRAGGLQALDMYPGALNRDGTVAVGGAAIWEKETGTHDLFSFLRARYGLETGLVQFNAYEISADGRVILGRGRPAGGVETAYVITLGPPVAGTITVNRAEAAPDADLDDDECDADPDEPGLQCTLTAAIQTLNAWGDSDVPTRVWFDLPGAQPAVEVGPQGLPSVERPAHFRRLGGSSPVEIRAPVGGGSFSGLVIAAPGVEVEDVAVTGFGGYGIHVQAEATGFALRRSFLGLTAAGDTLLNTLGGVRVEADDATIGGLDGDEANHIAGGIAVAEGVAATVLKNHLSIPVGWTANALKVPLDAGGDGPTCAPWEGGAGPGVPAGGAVPAPRLTRIVAGSIRFVEGMAAPGATVVVYRVLATGVERGRYFARQAEPIGHAVANETGFFSAVVPLQTGDLVAATATVEGSGTSELSQLRRPVLFVPGVGGSTLSAVGDGKSVWLPVNAGDIGPGFSRALNDNLARLAMQPGGASAEPVAVGGVLEVPGAYGPVLAYMEQHGYPGDAQNANTYTNDLWRFGHDWRRWTGELSAELRDFIDQVTADRPDRARSCEVDLVAHSNGGLVTSLYVRAEEQHSQNKIHRSLTVATPFLGAPQAIAAHTRGYVFGIEAVLYDALGISEFFDVEWGRMVGMAQHLPVAYTLLPSRAYWDAADFDRPGNGGAPMLTDLVGRSLYSYESVRDFLGRPKVDLFPTASGNVEIPVGLGRNSAHLQKADEEVHALIDDWRSYSRAPQIFRIVGSQPFSTAVGWARGPGHEILTEEETVRGEADDTGFHRAYRERLQPILGAGDATVPLVSATLGRDRSVGAVDLSGVDESRWIEEFEAFPCTHTGIMDPACADENGRRALDAVMDVLHSGYQALPAHSVTLAQAVRAPAEVAEQPRDLFHITGTSPLAVTLTDPATGRQSGGRAGAGTSAVAAQLAGATVWPAAYGAVVALPAGTPYVLDVKTAAPGVVEVTRLQSEADDVLAQALFPRYALAAGGALRVALDGGALAAPVAVDADGDGLYETTTAPIATGPAYATAPAFTALSTTTLRVQTDREGRDGTVRRSVWFTGLQGEGWHWSVGSAAPWLRIRQATGSGATPIEITTLMEGMPSGVYRDTLHVALQMGEGYQTVHPLYVEVLHTGGELPVEFVSFSAARDGSAVVLAWQTASETNNAGFAIEQQAGGAWREVAFVGGAGTSAEAHAYTHRLENLTPGLYRFRLRQVDFSGVAVYSPEAELTIEAARALALLPPAPNPASGPVRVSYTVPVTGQATLALYDALGRQVAVLSSGTAASGVVHHATLDAAALAPGLYFVRIETAMGTLTRPLTITR